MHLCTFNSYTSPYCLWMKIGKLNEYYKKNTCPKLKTWNQLYKNNTEFVSDLTTCRIPLNWIALP